MKTAFIVLCIYYVGAMVAHYIACSQIDKHRMKLSPWGATLISWLFVLLFIINWLIGNWRKVLKVIFKALQYITLFIAMLLAISILAIPAALVITYIILFPDKNPIE